MVTLPLLEVAASHGIDARAALMPDSCWLQLQHNESEGLPVGVAAQELEQGQGPLTLQLPLLTPSSSANTSDS